MLFASDVRGNLREFGELHGVSRFGFLAKAVPRGHAIKLNFAGVGGRLQINESIANALEKIGAGDFGELRLRIVQVVNVYAFELQIAETAIELIFQKAGVMQWLPATRSFGVKMPGWMYSRRKYSVGSSGIEPSGVR